MNGVFSSEVVAKLEEFRARRARSRTAEDAADFGGFLNYVNHWGSEPSSPSAARLTALYDSITIWEVYKRLLPNKPHNPYSPTGNISCACPHEEGRTSLSMSINDGKGVFFCFHQWEGGNKMALYCEIRGLKNEPGLFHQLKRLMVWEFRNEDPYAMVEHAQA